MAFIIEGADELGKTTLAKRVIERCPELTSYAHMSKPPESFQFTWEEYADLIAPLTVQDRFHLGAYAYHPERSMTTVQHGMLREFLWKQGSVILVLYAQDDEGYRKRAMNSSKGQMFDTDTMVLANQRFRRMIDHDLAWAVDVRGYPTDYDVDKWIREWQARRRNARVQAKVSEVVSPARGDSAGRV